MSLQRRSLAIALSILAFLIAVSLVPINMRRQRARLATTLSIELGRHVTLGDVQLRLLPNPGFAITHGFTISDDPAFSSEPLLHAEAVTADLRLISLWQGRMEVAKITLQSPTINLVRDAEGHWNLESLLLRASQIPSAPTSSRHAEVRPRFPYIEASEARIDFKSGMLKSVYALTEADLSFWLESDDRWNARLEAKPVRTDIPVSDTGTLKFSGRFGRAATFGAIPFDGSAEISEAQLGQVSKLLFGTDAGWRGTLNSEISAQGTFGSLKLASKLRVQQFRRFDVATDDTLTLGADCSGFLRYRAASDGRPMRSLEQLSCTSPLGDGRLLVTGDISEHAGKRSYALDVSAFKLAASNLAAVYRNMKQNVPSGLHADGQANGLFHISQSEDGEAQLSGSGTITGLSISTTRLDKPLVFRRDIEFASSLQGGSLLLRPTQIDNVGGVSGAFSPTGYRLVLDADGEVPAILHAAQTIGLAAPFIPESGKAVGQMTLQGAWFGYGAGRLTGAARLSDITAFRGARALLIDTADVGLDDGTATLSNIRASLPKADIQAFGRVSVARPCAQPLDCSITADVRVPELSLKQLQLLLDADSGFFDRLINRDSWSSREHDLLNRVAIQGTLHIDHLRDVRTPMDSLSTAFRLADGKMRLSGVSATIAGGLITSPASTISFTSSAPVYDIEAKLTHVSVAQLFGNYAPPAGILDASVSVKTSGNTINELSHSAEGTALFDLSNGTLLQGSHAFPYRHISGTASITGQKLVFNDAEAIGIQGRPWSANGHIDFARTMEIHLANPAEKIDLVGPIATEPVQKTASKKQ